MLVVTTLQFRALQPSAPTALVMLSTFGTFGKTQVLFSGKDFTGDISSISETTVDAIVGDLDNDSVVDGADLGILLGSWGPCEGCPADLNGNGIVDGADLGMLLSAWTP